MVTYVTIINGAAGGGSCRKQAPKALQRLREAGLELKTLETEGPGHATELTRRAYQDGHRHFLALGGDGTTYEVLNGLFPRDEDDPIVLGSIPLGTGNSFLRDFGVTDADAALAAVIAGNRRAVDVIRADHTDGSLHYLNLLSLGFTADVGDLTNRRFKALGLGGYAVSVVVSVARLGHTVIPLRVDENTETDRRPCTFLSFSNSQYTGGTMWIAPGADSTDGRLDVIRAHAMGRRRLLTCFPRIYQGTHVALDEIETLKVQSVDLDLDGPLPIMVDGEVVHLQLTRLEVLPHALEILA